MARIDIHQEITDRIIKIMEQGFIPWTRPWQNAYGDGIAINGATSNAYSGINAIILGFEAAAFGWPNIWMTFKQAKAKGGFVQKGSKGTPIVVWKSYEKGTGETDPQTGLEKTKGYSFLKQYKVFNIDQIEGIDVEKQKTIIEEKDFTPIDEANSIIKNWTGKPVIETSTNNKAYYRLFTDSIHMPKPETFHKPEMYYSVLFHEMTHSTGHRDRLDREGITRTINFGSERYSKEELIAEMGAAFLSGHAGIIDQTVEVNAAYLQSWIKVLKRDKRMIISAASAAQKATNHILGK